MKAHIRAVSVYLPEKILSNDNLSEEFPEWTVEKIASKIGISQRHIADSDETASDMAVKASEIMFSENNIDPKSVDFILLCTQSPDYFLPTTACLIQERLGIPTTAGAIDFNQGCSGYVYGLALAKGLISGGIAKNILLITSETYSKYIHQQDKSNRAIFGDAATATLISTEGDLSIENFELGSDGSGSENLIVKNGASKNPFKNNAESLDQFGNIVCGDNLYMNGSEIFNFTLQAVPKLIEHTLLKNQLVKEDIDLFVFHQANAYMLNHLRKKIGISEDRFAVHMKESGNTVSSTIPIVLKKLLKGNELIPGNKLLLAGFGVGYSWAGTILTVK